MQLDEIEWSDLVFIPLRFRYGWVNRELFCAWFIGEKLIELINAHTYLSLSNTRRWMNR
jgi:hypothetical protein